MRDRLVNFSCFRIYLLYFVVAIFDLVHDVEAIFLFH